MTRYSELIVELKDEIRDLRSEKRALQDRLDDAPGAEQCCPLGCDGGACESCPCCQAGWCVFGASGIPEDPEDFAGWLQVAAEHNPVARSLAEAHARLDSIQLFDPVRHEHRCAVIDCRLAATITVDTPDGDGDYVCGLHWTDQP